MEYKAILFDMDGVVVDTKDSVTRFWQELAGRYGFVLTEAELETHVYGRTAEHAIEALFPMVRPHQRKHVLNMLHEYEASLTYVEIPGATSLMRSLNFDGVPLALVTSAEPSKVDAVLAQLELTNAFLVIVHAGDVQAGKPDPGSYLLAASRLAIPPERCLVFEDALRGIEAAVKARTTCIAVGPLDTVPGLLSAGAVAVIENFLAVEVQSSSSSHTGRRQLVMRGNQEVSVIVDTSVPPGSGKIG